MYLDEKKNFKKIFDQRILQKTYKRFKTFLYYRGLYIRVTPLRFV